MGANDLKMITTPDQLVEHALKEYESPLIGYAMTILKDIDRSRDVVQDTFIRLYKQDVEKVKGGLKSWLFTVCRNRALDVLRKEKRMVAVDSEILELEHSSVPSPDLAADNHDKLEQLTTILDRLSENEKTVIMLKFEQGLSYNEISEKTGLTSGNIGFTLHHGLKKLRDMMPSDML